MLASMVTPQILPKSNGLCVRRKQTKELLITFIFTFLREVLKMASTFTDAQFSSGWKRNLQTLEDSGRILYFTWKLSNSTPQFLSSIYCTGIGVSFQISPNKIERIQVRRARRPGLWSFRSATSSASRTIFGQPLTHFMPVMWGRTIVLKPPKDTYWGKHLSVVNLSVFEEN
jgi:hypothetical protein